MMVVVGAGTSRRGTCPYPDIDLADPAFWRRPPAERREAAFARLRRLDVAGVLRGAAGSAHPADGLPRARAPPRRGRRQPQAGRVHQRPGRHHAPAGPVGAGVFGDSMVNLDDPRHANLRGVVHAAFTPRVIAKIDDDMPTVAAADRRRRRRRAARATSSETVAAQLPLQVICTMMGIPERYRATVLAQRRTAPPRAPAFGPAPAAALPGRSLRALARLHRVVARVGRERRREPTDDLISALVHARTSTASALSSRELGSFFSLLLVAGVETTRNTIAHGLRLLTDHPDQRELLLADFDKHGRRLRRGGRPALLADHPVPAHGRPRLRAERAPAAAPATRWCCSTTRPIATRRSSPSRTGSTSPGRPTRTSASAAAVRTSASAPSLARQEMTVLFRELFTRLPGHPLGRRAGAGRRPASTTASAGCRSPISEHVHERAQMNRPRSFAAGAHLVAAAGSPWFWRWRCRAVHGGGAGAAGDRRVATAAGRPPARRGRATVRRCRSGQARRLADRLQRRVRRRVARPCPVGRPVRRRGRSGPGQQGQPAARVEPGRELPGRRRRAGHDRATREAITSPSGERYDWTSCLISSTPSYAFQYGYIEERAVLPAQRGFWPAFWTWQAAGVDRHIETDVYEFYSADRRRAAPDPALGRAGQLPVAAPVRPGRGLAHLRRRRSSRPAPSGTSTGSRSAAPRPPRTR